MIDALPVKLNKKQHKQKERYKKFLLAMFEKDMTMVALAKLLGVTPTMIFYIMWGERKSKANEKRLCEILGIDLKEVA